MGKILEAPQIFEVPQILSRAFDSKFYGESNILGKLKNLTQIFFIPKNLGRLKNCPSTPSYLGMKFAKEKK